MQAYKCFMFTRTAKAMLPAMCCPISINRMDHSKMPAYQMCRSEAPFFNGVKMLIFWV